MIGTFVFSAIVAVLVAAVIVVMGVERRERKRDACLILHGKLIGTDADELAREIARLIRVQQP